MRFIALLRSEKRQATGNNARRIWVSTPQNCPTTNRITYKLNIKRLLCALKVNLWGFVLFCRKEITFILKPRVAFVKTEYAKIVFGDAI